MMPITEPLKIRANAINKIISNICEKNVFKTIELTSDALGKFIDFISHLCSRITFVESIVALWKKLNRIMPSNR